MQESRLTSLLFGTALAVVAIWMGQPTVTEHADEAAVMVDARQAAVPAKVLDVGCDGDLSSETCATAAKSALGVAAAIEQRLDVAEELVQAGEVSAVNL